MTAPEPRLRSGRGPAGLTAVLLACLSSIALVPTAGPRRRGPWRPPRGRARRLPPAAGCRDQRLRARRAHRRRPHPGHGRAPGSFRGRGLRRSHAGRRPLRQAGAGAGRRGDQGPGAQDRGGAAARRAMRSRPAIDAREVFRVSKAMNAIAVAVDPAHLRTLPEDPGRQARAADRAGVSDQLDAASPSSARRTSGRTRIGLPAGADGTGIRIGVIDTGIDYLHADFGGTGLLADYQAETTATANFTTGGYVPDRQGRRRHRLRGRRLHRRQRRRSPTPTRWTATATAATSPARRPASASPRPAPPSPAPMTPTPPPTARCASAPARRPRRRSTPCASSAAPAAPG